MKIILQFQVLCSQCDRKETYHAITMFSDHMEHRRTDAEGYFISLGWMQLPSGTWTCGNPHDPQSATSTGQKGTDKGAIQIK